MDIRLKAAIKTAVQVAAIFAASVIVIYFSNYLSDEMMLDIFLLSIVGLGSWLMYTSNLVELKQREDAAERLEKYK
jgi:hypothetical protein